jgi:AraC-like DNA-binding protein
MRASSQARSQKGLPLEHYQSMLTQSPDEAKHWLYRAYGVREFSVIGSTSNFFAQSNHKPIRDISLAYCAYGGTVELEFPESKFARQLFPLFGKGFVQVGRSDTRLQIDDSLPLPAGQPIKYRYTEEFQQIVLRVDEIALINKLTALLGSEPGAPIRLDWEQPAGEERMALRNLVMYLVQAIHPLEKCGVFSPVISEIEQTIITTFLYANRSNYSDLLRASPKDAAPWQVRAVEDYILSNWNQPIDMLQLVKITGASARSIFQAFARTRGYSPKVFLKRARLTHARARLQSSSPDTSVTAVALSCGFHNLGHFARDYQAFFGELPSETLAKQRRLRPLRAHI